MHSATAEVLQPDHDGRRLDLWMAMLAGDQVWTEGHRDPRGGEEGVAAFLLVALAALPVVQWVALASRVDLFAGLSGEDGALLVLTAISIVAVVSLAVRPARTLLGVRRPAPAFVPSLMWRGLAYLALIVAMTTLISRYRFVGAIPLGVVGGADAAMALWAVGTEPRPRAWLKRFTFSTVHCGVVGAMLAATLVHDDGSRLIGVLGEVYIAMWCGVLVATVTAAAINRLRLIMLSHQSAVEAEVRRDERMRRVHWLHDDVLSEVHLSTLRLGRAGAVPEARVELEDLEHRLRLRQLDETIRGGQPHIYEILQPHLRRAQSLGVVVFRVPPLEQTGRRVDTATAEVLHRVISVTTSNAINAGATRLAIDLLDQGPRSLTVVVADDAGGFDLASIPPGRGLSSLIEALGPTAISAAPTDDGFAVSVTVPVSSDLPAVGLEDVP